MRKSVYQTRADRGRQRKDARSCASLQRGFARTRMTGQKTKDIVGAVMAPNGLGDRQIRVVVSTPIPDRIGDVMEPLGCDLTNYKKNPIVLADHDRTQPIGTAVVTIEADRVEALITFAPEGASIKADQYCRLTKSGVVSCVSPGFVETETAPLKGGGVHIKKWELLEISLVAVPCNPEAVVTQRSYRSSSRQKASASAVKRPAPALTKAERLERIATLEARGKSEINNLPMPAFAHAKADELFRSALKRSAAAYDRDPFVLKQERLRRIAKLS